MGIQGLLPRLKSVTERIHVSQLKGKTVAIDAYCLLHKGAYTCARELVEGIPTDKCVQFCIKRIDVLIQEGVRPFVVLDGGPLPNKKEEEETRAANRRENRDKARALWGQGSRVASMEYYQRAVDITPEIAHGLVEALIRRNIEYIVAPYEADAQCAYLAHRGIVDAVLTEDSDLLAYGCPHVVLKFDGTGEADQIRFSDLAHCRDLSFVGWDLGLFQQMCVMAGCDFVKALPGIGIKKAHAHIRRTRHIQRAIRGLKFDGIRVPPEYEKKVQRALWTFKYQRVYCPRRQRVVHLNDLPEDGLESDGFVKDAAVLESGEEDFLGKSIPAGVARGIATGKLNPFTWKPYGMSDISSNRTETSIFSRKRPRNDASVSELLHHLNEDDDGHSGKPIVRKPNGQRITPLSSLKTMLNKALSCTRRTSENVEEEEEEDASDMKKKKNVGEEEEEEEAHMLFTPMWKPKRVDSLSPRKPLSPDNNNIAAAAVVEDAPRQVSTPGIYLPDVLESPENTTAYTVFGKHSSPVPRRSVSLSIQTDREKKTWKRSRHNSVGNADEENIIAHEEEHRGPCLGHLAETSRQAADALHAIETSFVPPPLRQRQNIFAKFSKK